MKIRKNHLKELFVEVRKQIFNRNENNFKLEFTGEDFAFISDEITIRISKYDKYTPFYEVIISSLDKKGNYYNREFEYYYSNSGEVIEKISIFNKI